MLEKNKGKLSNLSHLFHIMSHHRSSPRQRLFFVVCVFIENIRTSCLTSLMDIITDVSQQASWKSWTFWKLETCRKSLINSYQEEVSNFMWLFLGIMLRPLVIQKCHINDFSDSLCSFCSILILFYASNLKVESSLHRYKELWGFRQAIDDFFSVFFCRPFSLRINFVRAFLWLYM